MTMFEIGVRHDPATPRPATGWTSAAGSPGRTARLVMDSDNDVVVLVPHEHDDPQSAVPAHAGKIRRQAEPMLDDFLVRALLAGVGLALVTGPAGCFVVCGTWPTSARRSPTRRCSAGSCPWCSGSTW